MDGYRNNRTPAPPFIKIGRAVRYLREDLDLWLDDFYKLDTWDRPINGDANNRSEARTNAAALSRPAWLHKRQSACRPKAPHGSYRVKLFVEILCRAAQLSHKYGLQAAWNFTPYSVPMSYCHMTGVAPFNRVSEAIVSLEGVGTPLCETWREKILLRHARIAHHLAKEDL